MGDTSYFLIERAHQRQMGQPAGDSAARGAIRAAVKEGVGVGTPGLFTTSGLQRTHTLRQGREERRGGDVEGSG